MKIVKKGAETRAMKKYKSLFVILLVCFILSACGTPENSLAPQTAPNYADTSAKTNASDGEMQGGYYAVKAYDLSINEETHLVFDALAFQSSIFCVVTPREISEGYQLQRDGDTIYASLNYFCAAAPGCDGIWVLENSLSDLSSYSLLLISPDGRVEKSIQLSEIHTAKSYKRQLICSGKDVYLVSGDNQLVKICQDGELNGVIPLPDESSYPVVGNDGSVYVVQPTQEGLHIHLVDEEAFSLSQAFTCSNGSVFDGTGEALLLLENGSGLYTIGPEGALAPIVIWAECNITINGLLGLDPIGDGRYLLMCQTGPAVLAPTNPDEISPKKTLQLAAIQPSNSLKKSVADFNNSNSSYYVQILDYSDNGSFASDVALTRLNTDILSGNYPDMICFSRISPYPYMSKGLLTDLRPLIDQDEVMTMDDISIAKALTHNGGIYYISGEFNFETLVGRYSDFGDRYGWTLDEYLSLEENLSDDVETIHNMTTESFIDHIVARYIPAAIDWEDGQCQFYTSEFIELLEAGGRIRETPEDPDNLSYGYGSAKVGAGTRVASLSWVQTAWKLAFEEQIAGCRLSFIGWPTVDGICGSDAYLIEPVGIISHGEDVNGCWEFVRWMILSPDMAEDSLPVYSALLQTKVEEAKENEDLPVKMTNDDGERFIELVSKIETTAMYDQTVLDIIRKECAAFFSGNKTAEETAKIIQAKVSIYVSEQA